MTYYTFQYHTVIPCLFETLNLKKDLINCYLLMLVSCTDADIYEPFKVPNFCQNQNHLAKENRKHPHIALNGYLANQGTC